MAAYTPVGRGAENTLEYRLFYKNAEGQVIRYSRLLEQSIY